MHYYIANNVKGHPTIYNADDFTNEPFINKSIRTIFSYFILVMTDTIRKFAIIFVIIVLLILTVYYYIRKWYCV